MYLSYHLAHGPPYTLQLPPGKKRIYSVGEMGRIDIDHEIGVCELSPEVKKARRPEIFSPPPPPAQVRREGGEGETQEEGGSGERGGRGRGKGRPWGKKLVSSQRLCII